MSENSKTSNKVSFLQKISALSTSKMSAKFMLRYLEEKINKEKLQNNETTVKKYALTHDLYIKAKSFALLNKVFFILACIFSLLILVWPSTATLLDSFKGLTTTQFSIIQTSITGIAALSIAIYRHYKVRQLITETIMRLIVYREDFNNEFIDFVISEMSKIDQGYSFPVLEKECKIQNNKPIKGE